MTTHIKPTAAPKYRWFTHPYVLLTITITLWAGNAIIGRAVRDTVPPIGLAFWRWAIALVLLLPFAWQHIRRDWSVITRHWKILFILALLGIAMFNTLLYSALHITTAVNGTLLQSAMPVFVLLFSFALFRETVRARQVVGMLISVLGVVLIVAQGSWDTLTHLRLNVGDILVVIAVVGYAAYTTLLRLRPPMHQLSFLAATFAFGVVILLPLYLWESASGFTMPVSQTSMLSIGYTALFPSIVAYMFYNYGVSQIGANRAGIFIHLNPLITSLLAVALLGEQFSWYHPAGFVLILGGIVLVTVKTRSNKATAAQEII